MRLVCSNAWGECKRLQHGTSVHAVYKQLIWQAASVSVLAVVWWVARDQRAPVSMSISLTVAGHAFCRIESMTRALSRHG